jgi:hypothetical protein
MKDLLSHYKEKHPSASIHVLPAFERVNEGNFNGRVKLFNEEIKAFCAKDHNYKYIENRLIFSHNKSVFQQNDIHFTVTGQKCLARILKSHLNPKLGLRPYEEYHSFSGSKHVHHGRHIHSDQNRYKYGSPMRNDRTSSEMNNLLRRLLELTTQ